MGKPNLEVGVTVEVASIVPAPYYMNNRNEDQLEN